MHNDRSKIVPALIIIFFIMCLHPLGSAAQMSTPEITATFDLASPNDSPDNFNWYFHGTKREHGAHQVMWEPLFVLDYETGKLKSWMAKDIKPNEVMNEWTLELRDGVTWSDGESFDADDVVFTVEMVLREERLAALEAAEMRRALKPNSTENGMTKVNGVRKTGPHTVVFNLRRPDPRFALTHFGGAFFGTFLIMPEHKWRGKDPVTFTFPDPIGTGPYTFVRNDAGGVVWNLNPKWWGVKAGYKLPAPQTLVWRPVPGALDSRKQLVANDLDAAREFTRAEFDAARAENSAIMGWSTSEEELAAAVKPGETAPVQSRLAWNEPCSRQIDINTEKAPWNDARLRRAVSLLIDRTKLTETAFGGTTRPSRSMFVEYGAMEPYIAAVVNAGYSLVPVADPKAADTLLINAGWTKNAEGRYSKGADILSAEIVVNKDVAKDVAGAEAVATQLKAAGINVTVRMIDNGAFWGEVIPFSDYQFAYGWLSCGSVTEPYTSMARYTVATVPDAGPRRPGYDNTGYWRTEAAKAYTAKLDEIGKLPLNDAKLPTLVAEAYAHLHDEMPFVPLVQSPRIVPFNTSHWQGWPSATAGGMPMYELGSALQLIRVLTPSPNGGSAK